MRIQRIFILIAMLSLISGCYFGITGRVIDAETNQPIEGAIVLAQWTKTHGLGLTYHSVYKIMETETDKNGKFSISGAYSPFVDAPMLVIYKKGYVAWRNDIVFPGFLKRTDYGTWENNYVYKLEKYREGYSRDQHYSYLRHGIIGSSLEKTPRYFKAESDELEESLRIKRKSY